MPAGKCWADYNEHLVMRGEFYISLDFIDSWNDELENMNHGKRGHPYVFPESLFMFLAVIYHAMRIPYRALEGILRGFHKYIPALKVADYTTIAKRISKMELPMNLLVDDDTDKITVAMDSTGIKVTNRGDWIRKKWKVRRGWLKVHIAVDATKGKAGRRKILSISVTDERTGDSKKFDELLEGCKRNTGDQNRIEKVCLDGAYDSREIFNKLDSEGIEPVIRVRKNSSTRSRGSPKRAEVVRAIKGLGYKKWSKKTNYGYRWLSESVISAVKRMFGEVVRARKWSQIVREVTFRFLLYNAVITI